MSEVSNKTLATLLVVAIVVSLGGTFISLNRLGSLGGVALITGRSVDTGKVNVTIIQKLTIDTPENLIWFGEGNVNPNAEYAELWSNGTMDSNWENSTPWMADITDAGICDNCNNNSDFIIIENQGNLAVNLTVQSDKVAADFIGGAGPLFGYWSIENETNSCENGNLEGSSGTTTTMTTGKTNVCDNLNATDAKDTVRMYAYIRIPSDATGSKTSTLTFTSETVS